MEDAESTDPAVQVPSTRCLGGRRRENRESLAAVDTSSALNRLVLKDFQENPEKSRMDSFPKVCPEDAGDQGGNFQGPRNFEHSYSGATPYRQ